MNTRSQVKILSSNYNSVEICASAARISTTPGDAFAIYEKAQNRDDNIKLINNVVKSGHNSILEHATFTLAFCNVSAVVEQFIIEFRLASFTIKSRRYVDFGKMGYFVPSDLSEGQKEKYTKHMDFLFAEYQFLIDSGVPKEDARFVLPYSFYSNLYCTINARELFHVLTQMLYGRGENTPEIVDLAKQIIEQLDSIFPIISENMINKNYKEPAISAMCDSNVDSDKTSVVSASVSLINCTDNLQKLFSSVGALTAQHTGSPMDDILSHSRTRELELINATFKISNISLSGLTHIVRHRMQSIIIPSLSCVNLSNYIVPKTIAENKELLTRYHNIFSTNIVAYHELIEISKKYKSYFCLSGNTLDIITAMNAREAHLFFRLRCCNRAQWEIQEIAIDMLNSLRAVQPSIFNKMGPSCYSLGYCPEGRLACGKMAEVVEKFSR